MTSKNLLHCLDGSSLNFWLQRVEVAESHRLPKTQLEMEVQGKNKV